ncbi:WD40 repeat domain-containing protein [Actinomadura sp. NBRC 104425]|uniref:WD40 repeat domain-containing protein n=1 Tax=Actinomadura sp. NBRC 104425 TaxID=3032204 RepID=UPI0025554AC8|nr:WD40 repeat domain-containing protein [Actinomadura sp. NBRC 104425]
MTSPLDPGQVSGALQEFAFSPDERSLAIETVMPNGDNALAFWDLTGPRRIFQTRARLGYDGGAKILFAPDGKSLVAAPFFGRVAFPSGRVLTRGSAALQADAQTDDGTTLISQPSLYRPYIRRWDARTLKQSGDDLRIGKVIPSNETASVSPDGRLFATAHQVSPNYQIKLWDGRARAQLGVPLTGPVDEVVATTFTPDGSALVSVDKMGRFHTYATAPARLIRKLCGKSGQLTRDEWETHIPDVPYRETC